MTGYYVITAFKEIHHFSSGGWIILWCCPAVFKGSSFPTFSPVVDLDSLLNFNLLIADSGYLIITLI
jgi:hypothetical protein